MQYKWYCTHIFSQSRLEQITQDGKPKKREVHIIVKNSHSPWTNSLTSSTPHKLPTFDNIFHYNLHSFTHHKLHITLHHHSLPQSFIHHLPHIIIYHQLPNITSHRFPLPTQSTLLCSIILCPNSSMFSSSTTNTTINHPLPPLACTSNCVLYHLSYLYMFLGSITDRKRGVYQITTKLGPRALSWYCTHIFWEYQCIALGLRPRGDALIFSKNMGAISW